MKWDDFVTLSTYILYGLIETLGDIHLLHSFYMSLKVEHFVCMQIQPVHCHKISERKSEHLCIKRFDVATWNNYSFDKIY